MSRMSRTVVGALAASCLVVAACGSDEKTTESTGATTPPAASSSTATTTASSASTSTAGSSSASTSTAAPSSTAAGSAPSTAAAGAPQPNMTPASQLGLIDGVYKGTSGFTIDPKECPADWDPHQGITDTQIKFMMSLPTSGPLAGFGAIGDGVKSYFDYINSQGGIDGRQLVVDLKDDGYQPDKTKSNVDEAIGSK